jgi:molecular chaperone DnaK (HSP70)
MKGWALDLGTTNSGIARWEEGSRQPQLVELHAICRQPERDDPLEAPRMVPSAVHFLEHPGLVDRLGSWPPVARRFFLGRRALVGRPALERNRDAAPSSASPGPSCWQSPRAKALRTRPARGRCWPWRRARA